MSYYAGAILLVFNFVFSIICGYCTPRYRPKIELQPAKMPRTFSSYELGQLLCGCTARQISALLEQHDKLKTVLATPLPFEYLDYAIVDYRGASQYSPRGKETEPIIYVSIGCALFNSVASVFFLLDAGCNLIVSLIVAILGPVLLFITYRLTKKFRNNDWTEYPNCIKMDTIFDAAYAETDVKKITADLELEYDRVKDIVGWREMMLKDHDSIAKLNYQVICVLTAINVILLSFYLP